MTEKQNILYVVTKANFGGAQKYIADLAKYFVQDGSMVTVAHGANDFGGEPLFEDTLAAVGARTILLSDLGRDVHFFNDIRVFFSLLKLFREESPDIVHLNSSKVGALGAVAARVAHIPRIVFTVHGMPHKESRPWWQRIIIKMITWGTCVLVHAVIVISDTDLKEVQGWWGVSAKSTKIYNGVGVQEFLPRWQAQENLAKRIGVSLEGRSVIGSIAELTKNKGLLEFLPVLAALKEKQPDFVYFHFGTGEQKEMLIQKTQELELTDNVFWLGFDAGAVSYLKAFDVFTLPSLKEGLPYTLLEAGLASLPVVATNVGGVNEILTNEQTGIVVAPGDTTAITTAIITLFHDPTRRKTLSRALNTYVTKYFSQEAMCEQTMLVYWS